MAAIIFELQITVTFYLDFQRGIVPLNFHVCTEFLKILRKYRAQDSSPYITCWTCIFQVESSEIVPPPPDILPVIDKMASYVAKNGPDFEYVVKNKADGRFDFVHSWHQHNAYYEYRKKVYTEVS